MLKRKKLVNQALLIKFIENSINKTLLKISTANKKSRQYAKIHKAGLIKSEVLVNPSSYKYLSFKF